MLKVNKKISRVLVVFMILSMVIELGAFAQYMPAGANPYVDAAVVDLTPSVIKTPVTNATNWTAGKVVSAAKWVGGIASKGWTALDSAIAKPGSTGLPAAGTGTSTGSGQGSSQTSITVVGESTATPVSNATGGMSKAQAMQSLGITQDARGVYHQKGVQGAITTQSAQNQIINAMDAGGGNPATVTDVTMQPSSDGNVTVKATTGSGQVMEKTFTQADLNSGKVQVQYNQETGEYRIVENNQVTVGEGATVAEGVPGQSAGQGSSQGGASKEPGMISKAFTAVKNGWSVGVGNAKVVTNATLNPMNKAAWGNVAIAAGMTAGASLIGDIASGQAPDFKKAFNAVASREFAGSYIGGSLGAAGGCIAQGLLSSIPVVGPIVGAFMPSLGAIVGSQIGGNLAGQTRNGTFSIMDAIKSIDAGKVAGQAVGSTLGSIVGSALLPGVGTVIGGMVGAFIGGKVVDWLRGKKGNTQFGGNTVRIGSGNGTGTSGSGGTSAATGNDARIAYQEYIAAYNKLTSLMANGKGDTPEAQAAYAAYKAAKDKYEAAIK